MKRNLQNDKNTLLLLASLAVVLLGLISYFFSITNPRRQVHIETQLDNLDKLFGPTVK